MSATLSSTFTALLLFAAFPSTQAPTVLVVAAASDLSNIQSDLQTAFCRDKPGCTIRFVNGSSGLLSQQIENGAPYDVFMSANARYADQLSSQGRLVPGSVIAYAAGRLGILWKDGKAHPLSDLQADWVRIVALPNPTLAPYGLAARQALEHQK